MDYHQDVPRWLDDLSIPGAAYAIGQAGRIQHMHAFGYADRERQRPFRPHTRVQIGRLTAALTAHLIDDWTYPAHSLYENVSIGTTMRGLFQSNPASIAVLFGASMTAADLTPVTYDGRVSIAGLFAVVLRGYKVDEALVTFPTVMDSAVFGPLGMPMAGIGIDLHRYDDDFAMPYDRDLATGEVHLSGLASVGPYAPAVGGFASVHDLIALAMADDHHIGWVMEKIDGAIIHWLRGQSDGYTAEIAYLPEGQHAFAVVTNCGDGAPLTHTLRHNFLASHLPTVEPITHVEHPLYDATPPTEVPAVCGRYERGVLVEDRDGECLLHIEPRALRLYATVHEGLYLTRALGDVFRVMFDQAGLWIGRGLDATDALRLRKVE